MIKAKLIICMLFFAPLIANSQVHLNCVAMYKDNGLVTIRKSEKIEFRLEIIENAKEIAFEGAGDWFRERLQLNKNAITDMMGDDSNESKWDIDRVVNHEKTGAKTFDRLLLDRISGKLIWRSSTYFKYPGAPSIAWEISGACKKHEPTKRKF